MSCMRPGRNGRAGFSLTEALVALAIAAFLAAVLTRFVSSTRMNALKVREEVVMDILSDSLLERLVGRELQPGRTDGRNGALSWHVDAAPISFYARARSVSQKKPAAASGSRPTTLGLTPMPNTLGLTPMPNQAAAKSGPRTAWSPYRVTAVINAPSGHSYAIDTIRIVPQRSEQAPPAAEQH